MCVVSMVMDHYREKWTPTPHYQDPEIVFYPSLPTQAEIDEFRRLLERAREYDKKNNEPNCELTEKQQQVQDLADELGVDVSFIWTNAESKEISTGSQASDEVV